MILVTDWLSNVMMISGMDLTKLLNYLLICADIRTWIENDEAAAAAVVVVVVMEMSLET